MRTRNFAADTDHAKAVWIGGSITHQQTKEDESDPKFEAEGKMPDKTDTLTAIGSLGGGGYAFKVVNLDLHVDHELVQDVTLNGSGVIEDFNDWWNDSDDELTISTDDDYTGLDSFNIGEIDMQGGDDILSLDTLDSHGGYSHAPGLMVGHVDLGSGDDTMTAHGDVLINTIDAGSGDDNVTLSYNMTSVNTFTGGSGNDTLTITDGAAVGHSDMGTGDDTVNYTLADEADYNHIGHLFFNGGSGDETDGDTFNFDSISEDSYTVEYYPETNTYVITLETGKTITFTNFENVTWPEDFDENDIIIVEEPGGTAEENDGGAIDSLFFDAVTSQKMIEEEDAKAQGDDGQTSIDMFI